MKQGAEKIFIIDDDFSFRKAVCTLLKDKGYQVAESSGRLDVIKSIIRENPDLVLLDLRMTEIDGEEILNSIKRKNLPFPVIIVSGSLNQVNRRLLRNHGACDFLMKPAEKSELISKVQNALNSVGSQRKNIPESQNLY